ncbi:hypothetical protein K8R42_04785 [bacterium]|nr:hypothetical protein [bacterium]
MAKRSDKKTVIVLLVILGIALVGSGLWLFKILKPIDIPIDVQADLKVRKLFRVKDVAIDNVEDFLKVDFSPDSIWEGLYQSEQYMNLDSFEIDINIEDDVGNPEPFTQPPALKTEE